MWMLGWVVAHAATVQVPVQGTLLDAAGNPVEGTHTLVFRLYVGPGAADVTQAVPVALVGGAFAAEITASDSLFDGSAATISVEFAGQESSAVAVGVTPMAAWAANAARLGGELPAAFRRTSALIPWSEIDGIPSDLADGDDVGDPEALGQGLERDGLGRIAIDPVWLATQTPVTGQLPTVSAATGACSSAGAQVWDTGASSVMVCNGSTWTPLVPVTIVPDNGARRWSDGSYAGSCAGYRTPTNRRYLYAGDVGSGLYNIDPDGAGTNAPYTVWCDQLTDGGGWTRVIVHAGQSSTSWFWSNSPGFYNNRMQTGSGSSTTADHLSFAFNDLPISKIMIQRANRTTVPVLRTPPAAWVGQTMRALVASNVSHTYGAADGALNGRHLQLGPLVYNTQRAIAFGFTQTEALTIFDNVLASDIPGGMNATLLALDRQTWSDPWHVQAGAQIALIDVSGNGAACSKLSGQGYSVQNGQHQAGHDTCTATTSGESWIVSVR